MPEMASTVVEKIQDRHVYFRLSVGSVHSIERLHVLIRLSRSDLNQQDVSIIGRRSGEEVGCFLVPRT